MKFIILAFAAIGLAAPAIENEKRDNQVSIGLPPNVSPNDANVIININILGGEEGHGQVAACGARGAGK